MSIVYKSVLLISRDVKLTFQLKLFLGRSGNFENECTCSYVCSFCSKFLATKNVLHCFSFSEIPQILIRLKLIDSGNH